MALAISKIFMEATTRRCGGIMFAAFNPKFLFTALFCLKIGRQIKFINFFAGSELNDGAFFLVLLGAPLVPRGERCLDGSVKHRLQALLRERGALQVRRRLQVLR
jgi:hypothetical protein